MQQLDILQVATCICDDADTSPGLCALASATVVTPLLSAFAVSHGIGELQMRRLGNRIVHLANRECEENM